MFQPQEVFQLKAVINGIESGFSGLINIKDVDPTCSPHL